MPLYDKKLSNNFLQLCLLLWAEWIFVFTLAKSDWSQNNYIRSDWSHLNSALLAQVTSHKGDWKKALVGFELNLASAIALSEVGGISKWSSSEMDDRVKSSDYDQKSVSPSQLCSGVWAPADILHEALLPWCHIGTMWMSGADEHCWHLVYGKRHQLLQCAQLQAGWWPVFSSLSSLCCFFKQREFCPVVAARLCFCEIIW